MLVVRPNGYALQLRALKPTKRSVWSMIWSWSPPATHFSARPAPGNCKRLLGSTASAAATTPTQHRRGFLRVRPLAKPVTAQVPQPWQPTPESSGNRALGAELLDPEPRACPYCCALFRHRSATVDGGLRLCSTWLQRVRGGSGRQRRRRPSVVFRSAASSAARASSIRCAYSGSGFVNVVRKISQWRLASSTRPSRASSTIKCCRR